MKYPSVTGTRVGQIARPPQWKKPAKTPPPPTREQQQAYEAYIIREADKIRGF